MQEVVCVCVCCQCHCAGYYDIHVDCNCFSTKGDEIFLSNIAFNPWTLLQHDLFEGFMEGIIDMTT